MKVFQIVCAFLLVISICAGIWFISSSRENVHVYYVIDDGAPELTEFAQKKLSVIMDDNTYFSFSMIEQPSDLTHLKDDTQKTEKDANIIILGCFTEACKLKVITALGPDNTLPFLFTGRSNGLVSESYLWHFGALFNQNIQPILGVVDKLGYEQPVVISDESVSSYLSSHILKDLTGAKGWNESRYINIEQDLELSLLDDLMYGDEQQLVINTTCQARGEQVLNKLASSKSIVFNTCLIYDKKYKNGYFTSVLKDLNQADQEREYTFNLALYFIELYLSDSRFKFNKIVNLEFPIHGQTVVMDYKNRHIWHQIRFFGLADGQMIQLFEHEVPIRPVVYHQLRQPTEWELMVELYWRNHNGSWGE